VAVADARVEPERRGDGEHPAAERPGAEEHGVDTDAVERADDAHPVHGVREPEAGVGLVGTGVGPQVVGVHRLPPRRARRRSGLVEVGEPPLGDHGHVLSPLSRPAVPLTSVSSSWTSATAIRGRCPGGSPPTASAGVAPLSTRTPIAPAARASSISASALSPTTTTCSPGRSRRASSVSASTRDGLPTTTGATPVTHETAAAIAPETLADGARPPWNQRAPAVT